MENVVLSDTWLYYWLCNYQIHGTFEEMKNWSKVNSLKNKSLLNSINPLSASVAIIYKSVNWFAVQQWHLMG